MRNSNPSGKKPIEEVGAMRPRKGKLERLHPERKQLKKPLREGVDESKGAKRRGGEFAKIRYKIITLSIITGLFVWVIDTLLDYFIFYEGTFWNLLIYDVPQHEIYIRMVMLVSFTVFGILMSAVIVHRKQAEEAVRESEERFRLLVEGVTDYAIFMLDPSGHIVSWNAGAEHIKGYRAEEIIGKHLSCFYPAEAVERGKPEQGLKVAATKGRFEEEGWRVRKDGSRFWASILITALQDEAGSLRGFSKITCDITERKRSVEALRESEEKYRSIFDTAASLIVLVDTSGVILDCNEKIADILGYKKEDVVGESVAKIIHPDYMEKAKGCLEEMFTTGFAHGKEYKMVRKNNTIMRLAPGFIMTTSSDGFGETWGTAKCINPAGMR